MEGRGSNTGGPTQISIRCTPVSKTANSYKAIDPAHPETSEVCIKWTAIKRPGSFKTTVFTWRPALDGRVDGDHAAGMRAGGAEEDVVGVAAPTQRRAGQPVCVAQQHVQQEQPARAHSAAGILQFLNLNFEYFELKN